MSLKPNAKKWVVKEQILEDKVTGLTFQFEAFDNGEYRLLICGDSLPYGNRTIIFNQNGEEVGGGTLLGEACRPTWLREAF